MAGNQSFRSTVRNTGHRNDGHTLCGPQFGASGMNRTLLESAMSDLERDAATVVEELATGHSRDVTDSQMQVLCWFAGLQILRSSFTLGYVVRQLEQGGIAEEFGDLPAEELQTALLGSTLSPFLGAWSNRNNPLAQAKDKWNPFSADLRQLRWDVLRYRTPSLVLSDAFAAQSGIRDEARPNYTKTERRWAMHGFAAALEDSARVTMALTPELGIHLHRSNQRKTLKAEDFNRYTVYSSRDFIAHDPDWHDINPRLHELVVERLSLQRMLRMAMPANF
ncbi:MULTISPECIES: DUF4238 domain-containing protein [Micrococcaceae]|uniref:DUF4238 domain-containing protein n=1 Tax=Micrococcaceae TaxID=1268 RepID=UPI000B85EF0A|nr:MULTISPECIES: DUF4238 domain-containing protein [Micrococcaceae]